MACLIFTGLLYSCSDGNKTSKAKSADKTAKVAKQESKAPAAAPGAKNAAIKPLLQRLLPTVKKIEYVFYKQGMSFSTETSGDQAILSYYNFVSDREMAKHNCKFDGGAVFRSQDGDIVMTADFVLVDGKCRSFVVTAEGKSYTQEMEDSGYKYLMNFFNIDMNSGQMQPK